MSLVVHLKRVRLDGSADSSAVAAHRDSPSSEVGNGEYRTGPTPSLIYFDVCCGQGEFSFLSARQKLAAACGQTRSHTNAIRNNCRASADRLVRTGLNNYYSALEAACGKA